MASELGVDLDRLIAAANTVDPVDASTRARAWTGLTHTLGPSAGALVLGSALGAASAAASTGAATHVATGGGASAGAGVASGGLASGAVASGGAVATSGAAAAAAGTGKLVVGKALLGAWLVAAAAGGSVTTLAVERAAAPVHAERARVVSEEPTHVAPATAEATVVEVAAPPLPVAAQKPPAAAAATPPAPAAQALRPQPEEGPGAAARSRTPADASAERLLIERARNALTRGAVQDATAALALHGARYPQGALSEDRDALALLAAAQDASRAATLRTRVDAFLARYPHSLYRNALERAATAAAAP